jgi:ABC-type phosphate transport system substrate-binding protein
LPPSRHQPRRGLSHEAFRSRAAAWHGAPRRCSRSGVGVRARHAPDRLGSSFPAPIYATWFKSFSKESNVIVDYQSKGSGAGIQDFINHTVDFAASDAALTDEEIAKVKDGVVLIPITAGEIVLAYNLPGVTELKLPTTSIRISSLAR